MSIHSITYSIHTTAYYIRNPIQTAFVTTINLLKFNIIQLCIHIILFYITQFNNVVHFSNHH